ncbi:MAG TPA: hypothetical protein VJ761_15180 [Ktedonobacteraceae bacterium]|nr:hypothetical protein [Ktedonobacteraceae bacterium]
MASNANVSNPIQIVPLHGAEVTKAGATPQLTYRGGPLISNVQVFTVFWGQAWTQSPQSDLIQQINGFFDYVLTSSLIDQLAEYSTQTQTIGYGSRTGTATVTSPDVGQSVADADIQTMLQNQITSNSAFPQPSANTLYFVYFPSGVTVEQGGSSSCQAFCGYHDNINGQIFYAVEPYPDCSGCAGNMAVFDALTTTSSHELCEAITDPIPGQGWYDDTNGEIGDICAWQTKQLGSYTVQEEWSNQGNSCV